MVSVVLASEVIKHAKLNQQLKYDSAELNHFQYGLMSVDSWKKQLSEIIRDEIDDFKITRENEKVLKKQLEAQLGILIEKIDQRILGRNTKSPVGIFKQTLMDSFVDIEDIKKGIPSYADAMIVEMKSPKSEAELKEVLRKKVNNYMKETFDTTPADKVKKRIIGSYGAGSEEPTKIKINELIVSKQDYITEKAMILISLVILVFAIEAFSRKALQPAQYILMTLMLIVLLVVGVNTPMIDMEAKITRLGFSLFDHQVEFKNQVLYFQSKSIMDVFWIMITHKQLQMKIVGILMVGFSVVFPILKMMSSLAYYYDFCQARKRWLIQFFVLKSGKWSMADVLVVAIFMAYIGFNGIVSTQLGKLSAEASKLEVLTTNGTSLQPGFYLFFTYTMLAMFLSGFLKRRPYESKDVAV